MSTFHKVVSAVLELEGLISDETGVTVYVSHDMFRAHWFALEGIDEGPDALPPMLDWRREKDTSLRSMLMHRTLDDCYRWASDLLNGLENKPNAVMLTLGEQNIHVIEVGNEIVRK